MVPLEAARRVLEPWHRGTELVGNQQEDSLVGTGVEGMRQMEGNSADSEDTGLAEVALWTPKALGYLAEMMG